MNRIIFIAINSLYKEFSENLITEEENHGKLITVSEGS